MCVPSVQVRGMSNLQKKAKEQVASYTDPNTPISSSRAKIYHQVCSSPLQVKICVHAQLSPMLCLDGFVSGNLHV